MSQHGTPAAATAPARPTGSEPLLRAARPPCTALAVDWLRHGLRDGERSRDEVMRAAARLGLTQKMVRVARERLGVVVERRGFGFNSRAYWCLPSSPPRDAQTGPNQEPAPCR